MVDVHVSQAAREAGETLIRELQCFTGTMTSDAIQAFARFEAETLERAAKVAEEAEEKAAFYSRGLGTGAAYERGRMLEAKEIATAIRNLKDHTNG